MKPGLDWALGDKAREESKERENKMEKGAMRFLRKEGSCYEGSYSSQMYFPGALSAKPYNCSRLQEMQ